MTIERKNDALILRIDYKNVSDIFKVLLISDVHFDSKKCDRKLLKQHLDKAKESNAKIFIFGDWFDCMGGKYDKRTTKEDIRPEYNTQTYFQDICRDSAKFLKHYKDNLVLLADGNHETSVKLRHEFDLLDDLRERLNPDFETNEKIFRGKYNGFIRFQFQKHNTRQSKTLYYTHGGGGNSPVTQGSIKTNRRQESIIADMYVAGHIHTEFEMPRTIVILNEQSIVNVIKRYHWQLGTYKNEFMSGGWADHKEFRAASIGGRWVEFMPNYQNEKVNIDIKSYLT